MHLCVSVQMYVCIHLREGGKHSIKKLRADIGSREEMSEPFTVDLHIILERPKIKENVKIILS